MSLTQPCLLEEKEGRGDGKRERAAEWTWHSASFVGVSCRVGDVPRVRINEYALTRFLSRPEKRKNK